MGKLTPLNVLLQSQVFFIIGDHFGRHLEFKIKLKINRQGISELKNSKKKKEDALIFDTPKVKAVSIANVTNKPYYYNYY